MRKLYASLTLLLLDVIEFALRPAREARDRRREADKARRDAFWRARGFRSHSAALWSGVSDKEGRPIESSRLRPHPQGE